MPEHHDARASQLQNLKGVCPVNLKSILIIGAIAIVSVIVWNKYVAAKVGISA